MASPVIPREADRLDSWRPIFDLTSEPMWICDTRIFRFLAVNQAALNLYGYSAREFRAMDVEAVFSADSAKEFIEYRREIRGSAAGGAFGVWTHRNKNGHAFRVEMKIAAVLFQDNDQDNDAILVAIRSITPRFPDEDETFRNFLDEAPFAYHETDNKGTLVHVNRTECGILGLDAAQIVGHPVWDFATPEEREESRVRLLSAIDKGGAIAPFRRKRRTPGGESVFSVHPHLITDPAGNVTGIRTVMLDLTETSQARQQIELQTNLLDQINDAVLTVDTNFRVQYLNAAAERLFRWSLNEAKGRPYSAIAGTVVTQEERLAIHTDIVRRGSWNGEIICTSRAGTQFIVHVSWSVLRDRDGNATAVVGIHRDLTAPKQMEQALRESEDRLKLAQSVLSLGTWELDLDSEMVQCSEQLLRLYGIFEPRGQLTFREWHDMVHPEDKLHAPNGAKAALAGTEFHDVQLRVIWPDGSVHWLHSKSRVIYDAMGEPRRMIGADFDITEHKEIEERLRLQHAELANSFQITELEKHVLDLMARGTPLQTLLDNVTRSIEAMEPDCVCTILLLDEKQRRFLLNGSGPSLPSEYMQALNGLEIGPDVGACGSAAARNETIIVEDIATDYRFAVAKGFVTSFGLRSCWSVPIRNFNDVVLGTFAMYHRRPATPHPAQLRLVEAGARIAGNVIEWLRSQQRLRETSERLALAEKAAEFGIWEVNVATGAVMVSEGFTTLLGLKTTSRQFSLSELVSKLHPDDQATVATAAREAIGTGTFQAEFRIVWPDGSIRWVWSQGRVEHAAGEAVRVTGALIDTTEQKQTEERLHILSSAVEQCPVSILITNLNNEIEYVNARLTESTGYTMEELKGKNPEILTSAMPAEHFAEIAQAIRTGQWKGVVRTTRKNGEQFWESVFAQSIRDAHGKQTYSIAVAEDITERLEMESALKLSEERFRIAAESSGDSIYEWDLRTDLVTVLGEFQPGTENLGLEIPWKGKDFRRRFYHPDDCDRVEAAIQRHLDRGEPFKEEFRVVLPNGEIRYYADQGAAVRDAKGQPYKWIGASRDITDQKKVERANAQLASIVENADAAIISKDPGGKVLTWNRGAERIYGYSADEMIGRNIGELVPQDRRAEDAAFMKRLRRGERIQHIETIRLTKSGTTIPILLTLSPMQDRQGNLLGIAHVAENITHVKELEQQLAQTQKLESIGQLAAGIAHEINTPIQYIGDNGKFLEDAFRDLVKFADAHRERAEEQAAGTSSLTVPTREALDEGVFEYLRDEVPKAIEQLLDGVDHVARIVLAMKEFSHPGPIEKIPVDINRAIESTILVSKNEWKYMAELTTDFDQELPPVHCLAGEFNQVMLNLIVNAAHAITDVVKDSGNMGKIHITTRRDGPTVEIRVRDTGCGIPKANQTKVFDPFFTTKAVGKGTGQGLAIAYGVIVQKHGGSIQLESEPGQGTTFIIHLPLLPETEAV